MMDFFFYVAASVAISSTVLFVIAPNAVHALLNLILSFLAIAVIFLLLGAPFAAALEVIIYAGAVMVLFVFVIMMLQVGPKSVEQERRWIGIRIWWVPVGLAMLLLAEVGTLIATGAVTAESGPRRVGPEEVGLVLLSRYLLAVELASLLLLPGILGAYYLGRRRREDP
ncbi:MAG: NADH-quinone oxidoreductase subunit J [Nitrospira sp.]|nr:NADH-quinone oxidoreductase subunit J [Nitrospira sp.]MBX3332905.1 NADH-quinone oxidoreductase subunit J [Nitrospira sp.]MDR4465534.1 NADH-quinone oxidoreductase subunit J [Nitrospira sp.]